jgi:hypothetical protein
MRKFYVKEDCGCWIEVGEDEKIKNSYFCTGHAKEYHTVRSFSVGGVRLHLSNTIPQIEYAEGAVSAV